MIRLAVALCLVGLGTVLADDDTAELGTIHAKDGVPISYLATGQGEPAIVFIHGWTCDHTHWRFQIAAFRESFQVIAVDLPGHGTSEADRESWSIDGLGEDVADVVRALRLKNVILVGHSMGGSVALAAAPKLRGIARGVVAVDSLHNVEFSFPPEVVDRMIKRFEDDFEAAWTRFMKGFFNDPDSEILKSILAESDKPDPKAAVALLRDFNSFDAKSALAAAEVPVRAINAAGPYPTAVAINRKYGDFDAVLIPDAGHFMMLEKPDVFNRQLGVILEQFRGK